MPTTERTSIPLTERVAALTQLGVVLDLVGRSEPWPGHACGLIEAEYASLNDKVTASYVQNKWFTEENTRFAFASWSLALKGKALAEWVSAYPGLNDPRETPKTVGLVLAGNIPLVGFHDVLCVWLSGHKALIKCSGQDAELIPALISVLERLAPGSLAQLEVTTGKLERIDAVIATGSNNTSRYFEHYFQRIPRIVRKSRTSVAVLDGTETPEELAALGEDIFRYFGMGCRNISKLYLPVEFDLDRLFNALFPWKDIINHNKYANNYDYQRALWLLDRVDFLENGFVLLKEDIALASPMGSIYFERYTDKAIVEKQLGERGEEIQCLIGHGHLPFGTSQHPALNDYADGVDTLRFLLELG